MMLVNEKSDAGFSGHSGLKNTSASSGTPGSAHVHEQAPMSLAERWFLTLASHQHHLGLVAVPLSQGF